MLHTHRLQNCLYVGLLQQVHKRQTVEQEIMHLSHSRNVCLLLCTKQVVIRFLYCADTGSTLHAVSCKTHIFSSSAHCCIATE